MGIRAIDLNPPNGPTSLTPPGMDVRVTVFTVARTDTVASVKAVLPFNSTVVDIKILGVASNAGTSATISVGTSATATEWINAQDVKTAGGMILPTTAVSTTNLPNLVQVPPTGDINVYAKYAESGTASGAGGPYTVFIYYVQ